MAAQEKDRWNLVQQILADQVVIALGERVRLVFMAAGKVEADLKTKNFPAVGVLKARYVGEQPEVGSHVLSKGVATVVFLVYSRSGLSPRDTGEGEELLGMLRAHFLANGGYAPQPFTDEAGFPMWIEEERFEDRDGGRITQSASYAFEVWMTHTD